MALPDFAFGAMENAGAVFFRDSILLLDAGQASPAELQRSAETIAHELSHMWFGNLVTMAWWNDLWLNESFATWMAYEILDGWQPDWRIWHDFAHRREEALEQDALATSHPIAPPIRSAREAHENFDAITYTKGASVLRMLERYLGSEVFREGIQLYLRRHRERHATAADLWAALSEVSDQPVEKIIAPGRSRRAFRWSGSNARTATAATRSRFDRSGSRRAPGASRRRGRALADSLGRTRRARQATATRAPSATSSRRPATAASGQGAALTWIYGNAGEAGFFRTLHGESEWEDLLAERASLSPLERIGLVGNQWALARAGREPLDKLLDLVASLGDDDDPDVLAAVERVLTRLLQRVVGAPAVPRSKRACGRGSRSTSADRSIELGLEPRDGDDMSRRERRARVFAIVGRIGRAGIVREHCTQQTRARARRAAHRSRPSSPTSACASPRARAAPPLHEALRRRRPPRRRRPRAGGACCSPSRSFRPRRELAKSLAATVDAELAPAVDRAALAARPARPARDGRSRPGDISRRPGGSSSASGPRSCWRGSPRGRAPALAPEHEREIAAFFKAHPLAAGPRTLRQIREELGHARRYEPAARSPARGATWVARPGR